MQAQSPMSVVYICTREEIMLSQVFSWIFEISNLSEHSTGEAVVVEDIITQMLHLIELIGFIFREQEGEGEELLMCTSREQHSQMAAMR